MTSSIVPSQWAFRSQKAVGIATGAPTFTSSVASNEELRQTARVVAYSPDGSLLAAAFDDAVRLVATASDDNVNVLHSLAASKVVDMRFSPRGRFLSTWERPAKDAEGNPTRNLCVWDTATGARLAAFERKSQDGCHFQYTVSESHAIRQVSTELQVLDASDMSGPIVGRLRLEGMTSYEIGPGEKPSIAVFCGEKKGAPASVRVYSLASLIPTPETPPAPISQKSFFKADKILLKWNQPGTSVLFQTSTEHDKTGKSYYGETNLYMMSTRGDFDCRVALDKEGPVHDFEWNPNGREFIVIYGFMPAKTTLFSYRVNVIAELGVSGRNFAAFNPQGRLLVLAGFGNLNGTVDIWDRELLGGSAGSSAETSAKAKLFSFDASNSSVCQWSPDGQFILTATLSPRLRVENGVKIWHCTGRLVHVEMVDEMYQATWRPELPWEAMAKHPFPKALPAAPDASPAAQALFEAKAAKAAAKPTGAYRPPGARGTPSSDFQRLYQESAASSSRSATPSSNGGAYAPPGSAARGGKRTIPGAAPPGSSSPAAKAAARKPNAKTPSSPAPSSAPASEAPLTSGPADVGGSASSIGAIDKKLRNLTKKLKAIQELKEKRARGEKLEQTQILKIEAEPELRAELASLE